MKTDPLDIQAKRDPSPGASGVHPAGVGSGVGVGVIVAGAAGSGEADGPAATASTETIDTDSERAYWEENFRQRQYVEPGSSFSDYGPAYAFGLQARMQHPGREFDDAEYEMSSQWASKCGTSSLSWEMARPAAQDAWNRISTET